MDITQTNHIKEVLSNIARDINLVKNGMHYKVDQNIAVTRIFTGQKMFVDTRDLSLAPHLILEGIWEMEFTTKFRSLVKSDSTIIDIGANHGWFATVGSTENPEGKTIAIEANPELSILIEKTFEVNGLRNRSKVLNIALSDKEGTLELGRFGSLWGSSTIIRGQSESEFDKKFTIRASSLDNILLENSISKVDIIKMDIEGYEDIAWKGMQKTIEQNPQMILALEFTPSGYVDPQGFLTDLFTKFAYRYCLTYRGEFIRILTNEEMQSTINHDGFVMLILSNNEIR